MSTSLSFFRESGDGDSTVFLLHGAYGDSRYFDRLREALAGSGRRVVAWDCPGYGQSAVADVDTVEGFAAAATKLFDEVGTKRNVVLGHSMGSLIAPRAVNDSRRDIAGVILSASSPGLKMRSQEDQDRFIAERLEPIHQGMSVAEYAPALLKTMMGPGASGPDVDHVVTVVSDMDTAVFERSMKALTSYDNRPSLEALTPPTLLLAGEHDTACPPAGMRTMVDIIPNARYEEMSGVGHYGFAEDFDRYFAIVDGFLTEVGF
ncbi:alpha/beta fold hydrolase [Dietzia cinnamea]|uniref:alpha/beta fold hydrolase n=1 Tax=Dietzia cinnamea TaxID=321318 RepID=UPI00223B5A1A|nr:alpha/beta hydrolase [Dietzia cinnamea]MCT2061427.1 alpha/beta hydrolase [Dietzia cinnamea]MCT2236409.1 alpha/beta hydrolase [Dietzia cinnamea]MCT2300120.1 alpha/beta hydrolase [Dietzia cinnamea]